MCLARIDYNAKIPTGEFVAWKVFRLYSDGRMTAAYQDKFTQVPLGEWQSVATEKYLSSAKWRRNAFHYLLGFHAGRFNYAEALAEFLNNRDKMRAVQGRILQLEAVQGRIYHGLNGQEERYWLDSARSPLEVTKQDPCYTYVVRRVILRGVHTAGRQELAGRTWRTWVASEQFVPQEAN